MSRRDQIRMSPDEVRAFLSGRHTMNVATIGPDGRPHLVAMWYGFLDDAPAFWTFGKSQKIANLRRDPRLTCLVESGETYDQLKGVELVGTAALLDDETSVLAVGMSVARRYAGVDEADLEAVARATMHKRVAVRIDVEKVVSWDHTKLGGRY